MVTVVVQRHTTAGIESKMKMESVCANSAHEALGIFLDHDDYRKFSRDWQINHYQAKEITQEELENAGYRKLKRPRTSKN